MPFDGVAVVDVAGDVGGQLMRPAMGTVHIVGNWPHQHLMLMGHHSKLPTHHKRFVQQPESSLSLSEASLLSVGPSYTQPVMRRKEKKKKRAVIRTCLLL